MHAELFISVCVNKDHVHLQCVLFKIPVTNNLFHLLTLNGSKYDPYDFVELKNRRKILKF